MINISEITSAIQVMKMVGFEKYSLMPSFRVFSKDALDTIHLASCEVLEKTGIKIVHGESTASISPKECKGAYPR